uniref:PIN domain-containing protein n=1 Tax=Sporofaciens musculi TaxID=2681861 RepID=UPI002F40C501
RCTHSDKETRQILNKLFCLFGLLDTAGMDCRKAVSSNLSDFEDAVMTESAIREEMDCIVTRNLGDYKKAALTVYSPEEFLLNMK